MGQGECTLCYLAGNSSYIGEYKMFGCRVKCPRKRTVYDKDPANSCSYLPTQGDDGLTENPGLPVLQGDKGEKGSAGVPGQPGKEGKRVSKQRQLTSCVAWLDLVLTERPWPAGRATEWLLCF
ncbi:hypothetical protein GOODEAATRI_010373 [Goodea atripinnis]|uniref:Uncharacterized protein n=1 Tax=Goodea atripinnis TaxID=208336 RepID=A0ABV0NTG6_9TELE